MNKRGVEDILLTVGYVLIFLAAMATLVYWINSHSGGQSINDLTVAKQVALIIDSSRQGSTIFVDRAVSIDGSNVVVGYSRYEFFTRGKIDYRASDGGTEITIR